MFYRAVMIGITAFWLVMMGLLVRLETHPESTDILDVPVSYVTRIMFRFGQQSLLTVRDDTKVIGTVELRPVTTGTDARAVNFTGSLALPGVQRFNFDGKMNMDSALRMRDFRVDLTMHQPHYHLTVIGDPERKTLRYEVRLGDKLTAGETLPMNAGALESAMAQDLGLDLRGLPVSTAGIAPPVVTARETQIALRAGELEVYQVTVAEGSAPMLDFYVTQLGQVVRAKTSFGYTLDAEEWQ